MRSDNLVIIIGLAALGAIAFFILGYVIRKYQAKSKLKSAEEKARKTLEDARNEADRLKRTAELEAKDLLLKMRSEFENETKGRRQELIVLEKRLLQKEENLDRKVDIIERKDKDVERREHSLTDKEKAISLKEKELETMFQEEKEKLQRVSGMTREEARHVLLKRLEDEVKQEAAVMIKRTEEEAKEKADKEARKIVGLAIQKCAPLCRPSPWPLPQRALSLWRPLV